VHLGTKNQVKRMLRNLKSEKAELASPRRQENGEGD
jgi:hypothetical protein